MKFRRCEEDDLSWLQRDYRIVETHDEAKAGEGIAIIVPTLRLRDKVGPLVADLEKIATEAETISVLRPIHAYNRIKRLRSHFDGHRQNYSSTINLIHKRLEEPVDGGPSMDNAWFQSFATATGTSLLLQLQSAHQSVVEILDRKSAYSLASFSFYTGAISLIIGIIMGET